MEFSDVIATRRSVRAFSDRPVTPETIEKVLQAARWAPSWKNLQCWDFLILRDKGQIEELAESGAFGKNTWLRLAPVIIVACGKPAESGAMNDISYYAVDVAIAMQQLMLGATDLGLGTCWIGIFDGDQLQSRLDIPGDSKVVALTPLGYPAEQRSLGERIVEGAARTRHRRPIEDIIHYDRW